MSGHVPIEGHPGFYRRKGAVCFRYRDNRKRRRWASAPTIKAAQRKKAALETDVDRGEYREPSRDKFASYARSWIDTYAGRTSRGIVETTREDYRQRLEQDAIPYFGTMGLAEIEPRHIKEFARKLASPDPPRRPNGLAPNTVRLAVAPVRALFATAVEEGVLRSNPAAGLRLAHRRLELAEDERGDEQVKAMSEEELGRVLDAIERDPKVRRWWLFFWFLAWSGLRIGEAIELRWRDVDLGQRIVRVRRRFYEGRVGPPKSKYSKRSLRLTPELARALWRLRAETKAGGDDLVFTSLRGTRIRPSNLMRRVLKPAAVEAGLGEWIQDDRRLRADTWVGFHSFRHTCATILFRKGWNAVQVQRWPGHHKPSFTLDRYVHLLDQDVPEPTFFDALAGRGDHSGDQRGDQERTKQAETLAMPEAENPSKSAETPDRPSEAETPAVNF